MNRHGIMAGLRPVGVAVLALVATDVAVVSAQESGVQRLAVVEVERLLTESAAGKAALERIQTLGTQKESEIQAKEGEIGDLRKRISEGQLSLSEDRQAELSDSLQQEMIGLNRMRDDAARELKRVRDEAFETIETRVIPLIAEVAEAEGYSLVFNKFQSGLLFAVDRIDITDEILERFDSAAAGTEG
jgi:outer membrane protein